jgi:hypothetical protein
MLDASGVYLQDKSPTAAELTAMERRIQHGSGTLLC